MAFTLGAGVADHGLQAWADAYSNSVNAGPVLAQAWELIEDCNVHDNTLDTDPPGGFGQLIRNADGMRVGIAGGAGGPGHGWFSISGGGLDAGGFGCIFFCAEAGSRFAYCAPPYPHQTGGAQFPDGRTVIDIVSASAAGVIVAITACVAAKGAGSSWNLIIPDKSPLLGGAGGLAQDQWNLLFPALGTSARCGIGGGGSPPPPEPADNFAGTDLVYWKEGYHIAQTGPSLFVSGKYHSERGAISGVIPGANVDPSADCAEPRLSHPHHGPPLSVTYRRGIGTDAAIFRQESYDYGRTWRPDPAANEAFLKGPNGLKHAVEIWNLRTGERVLLYNDQSELGGDGKPTGRGAIQANIYGPQIDEDTGLMKLVDGSPFLVTPMGVLADDSSFGAIFVHDVGAQDCVVLIGGSGRIFRSNDDGRSWQDVT